MSLKSARRQRRAQYATGRLNGSEPGSVASARRQRRVQCMPAIPDASHPYGRNTFLSARRQRRLSGVTLEPFVSQVSTPAVATVQPDASGDSALPPETIADIDNPEAPINTRPWEWALFILFVGGAVIAAVVWGFSSLLN